MLNSQKSKKRQLHRDLLPILLWEARQRRSVTYDVIGELQRLSLSKCFPALCHKLIYEIAIFHSINGETCYKLYIGIFCNIRVQPTRTLFYNLNMLHCFTMLPSHLYSSRLLEFLRIFKNLVLLGIHLKIIMYPYTL